MQQGDARTKLIYKMGETRMGLFGKLPREIRDEIYKHVFCLERIHLKPEDDQGNHKSVNTNTISFRAPRSNYRLLG